MIFPSKRSPWLGLVLFVPLLFSLISLLLDEEYKKALLPAVILIFATWLWFGTRYIIKGDTLHTWAGFIPFPKIPIQKIVLIKPTNSWLSAPACSFDRILLQYGSSDYLIISPKDKKGFVEALKAQNPEIEVKGKMLMQA